MNDCTVKMDALRNGSVCPRGTEGCIEKHPPSRSAMFFESDLCRASEELADEMESHGLTPEQADELSERVEETVRAFFAKIRE